MKPLDLKMSNALKEIEGVYAGRQACHAYYDQKNKVYVLVVSGEEAEAYQVAVKAIHDLAESARRLPNNQQLKDTVVNPASRKSANR
jgi:hypothetical protein